MAKVEDTVAVSCDSFPPPEKNTYIKMAEKEVVKEVNHLESWYVLEDSHRFTPFLDPTIHKTHQRFGNSESQVEHCDGGAPSFLAQASFYSSWVMQRSRTVEITSYLERVICSIYVLAVRKFKLLSNYKKKDLVVVLPSQFSWIIQPPPWKENELRRNHLIFQNPHNHLQHTTNTQKETIKLAGPTRREWGNKPLHWYIGDETEPSFPTSRAS